MPDSRIYTDSTLNNILRLQWRICQTSHGKQPWEKTQVHLSIQSPLFGMEPLLSGGQPVLPRFFLQDPEFSQVQESLGHSTQDQALSDRILLELLSFGWACC